MATILLASSASCTSFDSASADEAGSPSGAQGGSGGAAGKGGSGQGGASAGGKAGQGGAAGAGGKAGGGGGSGGKAAGGAGGAGGSGSGATGGSGAGATGGSGSGAAGSASGASGGAGASGASGAAAGGAPSQGKTMWAGQIEPLVESKCGGCHVGKRFGFASLAKAGGSFTEGETEANYQAFLAMISLDSPEQSRLLQKAMGEGAGMPHAGGAVIAKGDPTYQTLSSWVATEKSERCPDCGLTAKTAALLYVDQPEIFWALSSDPYRKDHGLRDRARIVYQPVDPLTMKPTGEAVDFLGDFCGADGRCDFGRIAVSHDGDRVAFECRLSLEPADWVDEVRWNLCVAEIGPGGHAQNPRFLLPAAKRHKGMSVARSDPFGLENPDGTPLKGAYDQHFQTRRRYDAHPAFSPDDQRIYYASQGPEPRSGASATQAYHGFEHLGHIVAIKPDGTDARTIYVNDGGVADAPFFLKNGNVAFHTWNLERMDRHLYTQSTADGMNELPALLGRLQGPNMWGLATQAANGAIVGVTGRRRSSVSLYAPFAADHTLGTFGDATSGAAIDPNLVGLRLLDPGAYEQIHDFPDGYCTQPPDGPSCATSAFYADASYSPDGRVLFAHNPEKTYVLQGEDMFLAYAKGDSIEQQIESMRPYVPKHMGISLLDTKGNAQRVVEPGEGRALRFPAWVGKVERPQAQPWKTEEAKATADLHIASVPVWMSFARSNGETSKPDLFATLKTIAALRVLEKPLEGDFCLNDGRPYRHAVNAGVHDHPTHLGINNATGYVRLAVPQASGGDAFGDVPLEADGSVRLRLPAGKLLLFQGVDSKGHVVVQRSRLLALAPGQSVETSVREGQYEAQCMSCHGSLSADVPFHGLGELSKVPFVPMDFATLASQKPVVDASAAALRPATFKAALRPLFDAKCVSCHSGDSPAGELSLEGSYSKTANYPKGKWATTAGLADPDYLSFVPEDKRVPGYTYSTSYAWTFREDETEYKTSGAYASLIASHAPLGDLAPWDPAYQNLYANDGQRWVYLGGYFTPNFGRSDRLGGLSSDAFLAEVLTGQDLDPARSFGGPDHTGFLSDVELREVLAVIDVGFPYMSRCDDAVAPSGPNAGKPWGDPTPYLRPHPPAP